MEQSKSTTEVSPFDEELSNECKQLLQTLPKGAWGDRTGYLYEGFWCPARFLRASISFQRHFQAHDTDIVIASKPKSGTTWLKALVFATMNRKTCYTHDSQNPMRNFNSHELVPFFEISLYQKTSRPDLTKMASPRMFSTHIPYASLPESIKNSNCQIVYICRNPFDTFVSACHFLYSKATTENLCIDEMVDTFCKGGEPFGPFLEHVLGYWTQSIERPEKVLFLKYEDLKEDIGLELKRLAKFLGFPFSSEEESEGVIEQISKLCSFETQRDLEVNQSGKWDTKYENKKIYRKGEVGDWVNYLTPSMVERFDKLMQEKLFEFKLQSLSLIMDVGIVFHFMYVGCVFSLSKMMGARLY